MKRLMSIVLVVAFLTAAHGVAVAKGVRQSPRPVAGAGAANDDSASSGSAIETGGKKDSKPHPGAPAGAGVSKRCGIRLIWQPPPGVAVAKIAGYTVYRSSKILGHYERLNKEPTKVLSYDDKKLTTGRRYYYRVATVFTDGSESQTTPPVGIEAGTGAVCGLPVIDSFTSDACGKVLYLGAEAVFLLKGTAGLKARFSLNAAPRGPGGRQGAGPDIYRGTQNPLAGAVPKDVKAGGPLFDVDMREVSPGVYSGSFKTPAGLRLKDAVAEATLADGEGGESTATAPAPISFMCVTAPTLSGLYAGLVETGRVGLNWPRSDRPGAAYRVFRDTGRIVDITNMKPIASNVSGEATAYVDDKVRPGVTYSYVIAMVDPDGSVVSFSDNLEVAVPAKAKARGVESVEEDSGGATLAPGSTLRVTVRSSPKGKATFSVGQVVKDAAMTEGAPGVYAGVYTVSEGDGVFKSKVAASFMDEGGKALFGHSASVVSVNAPRSGGQSKSAKGGKRPNAFGVKDEAAVAAGRSGRLTAGKTLNVTLTGEPGFKAYFEVGPMIRVQMAEDLGAPGTYRGSYTVKPGDSAGTSPDPFGVVHVTGYLVGPDGAASEPVSSPAPVVVDTSLDIKVGLSSQSLQADGKSRTRADITVTDADGEPVAGRKLKVMIEPPPRYTGLVGAGGLDAARTDAPGASGRLDLDFDDATDRSGTVSATYTAGFAAKTAVITARDYTTGSVGIGYVTTGVSAMVNVTLEPPGAVSALGKQQKEMALDAFPNTLTADGQSRATMVATLTRRGQPMKGLTVFFSVAGAGGRLNHESAVTDQMGRAQVVYIAGAKAGKAVITATEPSSGASVASEVTLLADAPSKITVSASPQTLPADGASVSTITVELADMNNNPTDGVGVGFSLAGGSGRLYPASAVTDMRGGCKVTYTAGGKPGVTTINVNAMSAPLSPDDIAAALARVVAPVVDDNYDFTELTVKEWLRREGDKVGRGEPLAVVDTPEGERYVYSPSAGVLERIAVQTGLTVVEGKEIGSIRSLGQAGFGR